MILLRRIFRFDPRACGFVTILLLFYASKIRGVDRSAQLTDDIGLYYTSKCKQWKRISITLILSLAKLHGHGI